MQDTVQSTTTMDPLQDALHTLGLQRVPDLKALQQRFATLLKKYHPDRNRGQVDWATEQTKILIQACNHLKEHIRNQMEESLPEFRPAPTRQFQLIDGHKTNYAIPVDGILTIMPFYSPQIKKSIFGYYCRHENDICPLVSIDGKPVRHDHADYVVLIRFENRKVGVVIPRHLKFASIADFAQEEMVPHNALIEGKSGWLLFHRKNYLYPESLLRNARKQGA